MCVPSSLLACACLCDAISHMAPERLSACVETLAQLAGLEKVRTCLLCVCVCVVVEWGLVPKDIVQAYSAMQIFVFTAMDLKFAYRGRYTSF